MASIATKISTWLKQDQGDIYNDEFSYEYGQDNFDDLSEPNNSFNNFQDSYEVPNSWKRRESRKVSDNMQFDSSDVAHQVVIIKPETQAQAEMIVQHIRDNRTVICNFEGVNINRAQRLIDFISGAVYALDGGFNNITPNIFVISPNCVTMMGDEEETKLANADTIAQLLKFSR